MIHGVLFLIITFGSLLPMALMSVTSTFALATPNTFFFVSDTLDLRLPNHFEAVALRFKRAVRLRRSFVRSTKRSQSQATRTIMLQSGRLNGWAQFLLTKLPSRHMTRIIKVVRAAKSVTD